MTFENYTKLNLPKISDNIWEELHPVCNTVQFLKIPKEYQVYYKQCGKCKNFKLVTLFNRSSATKTGLTGNCKECQKAASKKSYAKNRTKINHRERYERYKEQHLVYAKERYQNNKEELNKKHKAYLQTKKGKATAKKAQKTRYNRMKNKGVPYTRELVIERDTPKGQEFPICYICKEPITIAKNLQLDHVIPIALGGPDCFTNLACTHMLCNLQKTKDSREISNKQIEEIMAKSDKFIEEHAEVFEGLKFKK